MDEGESFGGYEYRGNIGRRHIDGRHAQIPHSREYDGRRQINKGYMISAIMGGACVGATPLILPRQDETLVVMTLFVFLWQLLPVLSQERIRSVEEKREKSVHVYLPGGGRGGCQGGRHMTYAHDAISV